MEINALRNLSKFITHRNVSPVRLCTQDSRFLKCSSEKVSKKFSSGKSTSALKLDQSKKFGHFLSPLVQRNVHLEVSPNQKRSSALRLTQKQLDFHSDEENEPEINLLDDRKCVPKIDVPENSVLLEEGIKDDKAWFVLGHGCFGTVIKAKYRDKNVAVKVIAKDNRLKSDSMIREMNALKLNHPNIVKVQKVVNEPSKSYGIVIMELWHSTDLQQIIEEHPLHLDFGRKVRYILNVCYALEYCHSKKVIHMDVKPKNILVNKYSGSCKLCDFGNSCSLDSDEEKIYLSHQGTIKYMAPELFCGEPLSNKVDVYAMGITMWQIFHEETPYKFENLDSIVYKVVAQNHRPKKNPHNCRLTTESIEEGEFISLYENCWNRQQNLRPDINNIIKKLEVLIK